jgi:two-component system, chemotaxis family, chemotaxis protein CheV
MKTDSASASDRTKLAGNNKFEMLLFSLGESPGLGQRELFGINVFKVREILVMPAVTEMANSHPHLMGVANIRGQIIPVINLPATMGCNATKGLNILMVTEFGRTVQAFAVEDVREIVQLDWNQVLPADESHASGLVTGIARIDGEVANTRLAQVLDVEQILKTVKPTTAEEVNREVVGPELVLPDGAMLLAADDSAVARSVIELGLKAMGVPYIMTKTGQEAWDVLQTTTEKIAVVLTDLEMPEMDGFTLTKLIKGHPRFKHIPVVIHSSLTGATNENHVKTVGADAYVAKFAPRELAAALRSVLEKS